jgi:hypothetical protein
MPLQPTTLAADLQSRGTAQSPCSASPPMRPEMPKMQKTPDGGGASDSKQIHGQLIHEEIRAIVADAISSHQVLQVGPHAKRLSATYPRSGFSQGRIADELILAASRAGVPVEIHLA